MYKQSKDNDNSYKFKAGNKTIEVFFSEDDEHTELYDERDPGKTGFIFHDHKQLISFINGLTDVVEHHIGE